MLNRFTNLSILALLFLCYCRQYVEKETTDYHYHDITISDSTILIAVTNEEYPQYGADVAFITAQADTVIPFGQFAYFGSDTLQYFANVLLHPNDSSFGRAVGIDRAANILFDIVFFDNGPDYFQEGLVRIQRNGKMGFANKKGEVVIPCEYDYVRWFQDGVAEVTYDARTYYDLDEHLRVESDSWFQIDREGKPVNQKE